MGRIGLGDGQHLLHHRLHLAAFQPWPHALGQGVHHRGLGGDGTGAEGGADDPQPSGQHLRQGQLGLGAAEQADQHQPAVGGEGGEVVREVVAAHRVQDHVHAVPFAPSPHWFEEAAVVPVAAAVGAER